MRQWLKILIGVVVVIGIILAIALPLAAQKTLESTQVGLDYNPVTKHMDESQIYEQGRHSIGVSNYFIVYPTDIKAIKFEKVRTRTNDGLLIHISISFQYRLKTDAADLVELFYNFGETDYESGYVLFCRNIFRDVTSKYNAYDFITKRNNIQQDLNSQTTQVLSKYGAKVENFQLLDATFPGKFQSTIDGAQEARLEIKKVENQQKQVEQDVKGRIEQAQIDKKTIENQAESDAARIRGEGTQQKEKAQARIKNNISGSQQLIKTLGLTPVDLIKYTWNNGIGVLASKSSGAIEFRQRIPTFVSQLNP